MHKTSLVGLDHKDIAELLLDNGANTRLRIVTCGIGQWSEIFWRAPGIKDRGSPRYCSIEWMFGIRNKPHFIVKIFTTGLRRNK